MITLDNYLNRGGEGFGSMAMSELSDLQKALEAGSLTGRETADNQTLSGAPLKVESLEKTLKTLTYTDGDIVLWRDVPKLAAYNTVEEYNRLVSYGEERGGFIAEGVLPLEETTVYDRKAQLVKFIGNTRAVTHPMTLVKTNIGDAVQAQVKAGTLWTLRTVDRALTQANSAHISVEFNSYYAQHQAGAAIGTYTEGQTIIDMRGSILTESAIEEGMRRIADAFGTADVLYAPPAVLSGFTKYFYPNLRQFAPVGSDGKVGRRVTAFQSQFGEVGLKFDKFMNKRPAKTLASASTSDNAPPTPIDGGTVVTGVVASSKFVLADAGNYLYAVTAFNAYGESQLVSMNAGVASAVITGVAVDLTFTEGVPIAGRPSEAFRIYRTKKNETVNYYPVFELSAAELAAGYDGAAALSVRENNRFITDTDQAFLIYNSEEMWSFKQLAPLMKMDLAVLSPAFRFMILLYGTPILYQPPKMIRFINIGTVTP